MTDKGLVAYGTRFADAVRRIPSYIDRILQGEEPGNLPVESVTHQALIINLNTAREIGVVIPSEMLERADEVISSEGAATLSKIEHDLHDALH